MVLPSGLTSTIAAIDTADGPVDEAFPPMSVTVRLTDEIDISRGDMLCRPHNAPAVAQDIEAMICWMDETAPLRVGAKYAIKHTTRTARTVVRGLQYRLDVNTLHRDETALDLGLIDVAAITEPLWSKVKHKYRAVVVASEVLPPLDNVVGVTTVEMAEKKGDFLRAVIRARRKAVKFMISNPDEAAEIVAKQYNIELDVAKSAVRNLTTSKTQGVPYWGEGQIHMDGLKRMIEAQRSVGAITGEVDYSKIIDTRFLPDDLKALK